MSSNWQVINDRTYDTEFKSKVSSKDLFNKLHTKTVAVQFSCNKLCERVFRTGTFRGYDYNSRNMVSNNHLNSSFFDHYHYFRTDIDAEGSRKIFFITQPYLNDEECKEAWQQYMEEEEKIVRYISRPYEKPVLECLVLGKENSFYYPNNTNLVIIGLKEDIEDLKANWA